MLMTIEATALTGLLKKAQSLGSDLMELTVDKGGSVSLRGGRLDRSRGLPDPGYLLEMEASAPTHHASAGKALLGLKTVLTTVSRFQGMVLLAVKGRRLHVRGRLGQGSRVALTYPLLDEVLPKMPKMPKDHPSLAIEEEALQLAVSHIAGVLPSGNSGDHDRLADMVMELVATAAGSKVVVQVGATNGSTLLVAHLEADASHIALAEPKRLPLEAANALGQLGGGKVTLNWGNQLVLKGSEASLAVPLRAAEAPSVVQITLRAKPGDSKGAVEVKGGLMAEALDALKAAAADSTAKVQVSSRGKDKLLLVLEGSSNAEGSTEIKAKVQKPIAVRLGLEALRQGLVATKGQDYLLCHGGPQKVASISSFVEALGADAPVAILAPYQDAHVPAAAPAEEEVAA